MKNRETDRMRDEANFKAVDLFCGAGGLGIGLEAAGFEVVKAVDKWEPAICTYNTNFDHRAEVVALDWNSELPDADMTTKSGCLAQ